jgi:sugar fermentation stimulation protein A
MDRCGASLSPPIVKLSALISGRFARRDNRFRVTVEIDGEPVAAHLPNSGRLTELLTPGRPCWLEPASGPRRKTGFDLKLVEFAGVLVSVDARLPNPLLAEALEDNRLDPFRGHKGFEREVPLGRSRLDFRLDMPDGAMWIETKSVTLVERGLALFPDAPTIRGTRHVTELGDTVRDGGQAALVFVIQRPDARRFAPHDAADPAFAEAVRSAFETGVNVYAWTCQVDKRAIRITAQIPVDLDP